MKILIGKEVKECNKEELEVLSKFFKIETKVSVIVSDNLDNAYKIEIDHIFDNLEDMKEVMDYIKDSNYSKKNQIGIKIVDLDKYLHYIKEVENTNIDEFLYVKKFGWYKIDYVGIQRYNNLNLKDNIHYGAVFKHTLQLNSSNSNRINNSIFIKELIRKFNLSYTTKEKSEVYILKK